jgi:hypothetical protein
MAAVIPLLRGVTFPPAHFHNNFRKQMIVKITVCDKAQRPAGSALFFIHSRAPYYGILLVGLDSWCTEFCPGYTRAFIPPGYDPGPGFFG